MKKFWTVVNEVAGRTSDKERFPVVAFCDTENSDTSPSVENVCDSFNNFFASVGPRLVGALHPSDPAVVDDADHAASAVFDFRPADLFACCCIEATRKMYQSPIDELFRDEFIYFK
ncbi:hypothetical protein J6590_023862 [Homalodisca vitripennis]|nr:hypothetical protein J6590_023862 [Homalodisca vitripennis]